MVVETSQPLLVEGEARPFRSRAVRKLAWAVLRQPAAAVAFGVVALVFVVAIFAPWIAPDNPDAINVANSLASPSLHHLLGTDTLGRDNLSRLVYGSRVALEIALPSVLGAFAIGSVIGLVAGYFGGWADRVATVCFDTVISFPAVILGLALLTLLGPSTRSVILVVGLSLVPYYGRLTRAQTLSEAKNEYVKAERSLGASRWRVLTRHIMPNALAPLLVVVAMDIPGAVAIEAGLAFLGLGVQPPTPDWGVMLNEGFVVIGTSPWTIVGPVAALILLTTAFTVLGETVRDTMDPRHYRTRRRRFAIRRRAVR
ncbi:MAG: ABC transporter permease [Acidimicrobiales bacterium]